MAQSKYTVMNRISKDAELEWRVRCCITEIRSETSAQTTENDEAVQRMQEDRWIRKWMDNMAADSSIFSRYNGAISADPPSDSPGGDTSVISDAILKTAVQSVLGVV